MNGKTLDVLIVTYNRAEFFEKALRSVCDQSYSDFTIKVLDNGSTDDTEKVYRRVASQYPMRNIEYMRLSENHQDAFFVKKKNDYISADYVIVFHDDDLMHPEYVAHAMRVMSEHPSLVVLGGRTMISRHPEELEWEEPTGKYRIGTFEDLTRWYLDGDTVSFPALMYKADVYKRTAFRHDLYGNRGDMPFVIEIARSGLVCEMETRFLHYRVHGGQSSNRLPDSGQRLNLWRLYADICLRSRSGRMTFHNRVLQEILQQGEVDYEMARTEGWLTPETDRLYRLRGVRSYIKAKYMAYRVCNHVAWGLFKRKCSGRKRILRNLLRRDGQMCEIKKL